MDKQTAKPTFFWQGTLILLPMIVLAAMGLYSLRQDRILARTQAQERCRELGERLVQDVCRELPDQLRRASAQPELAPGSATPFLINSQGRLQAIAGSSTRAVLRVPLPQRLDVSALTAQQVELWEKAREAEFVLANATNATVGYRQFLGSNPPAEFVPSAKFALALLLAKAQQAPPAEELFAELENDTNAFTEAGLPIGLLAQFHRVLIAWKTNEQNRARIEALCSNAVEHPCSITPVILGEAARLEKTASMQESPSAQWQRQWERDEAIRAFAQTLPAAPAAGASWVSFQNSQWLMLATPTEREGCRIELFPQAACVGAIREILAGSKTQLPKYAQGRLAFNGQSGFGPSAQAPTLADFSGALRLDGEAIPSASFSIALADPAALYAAQQQRTLLFGALVLFSALAAVIGFWSAYRGFQQQLRLNQLKSNFVSSVSHELRAPIASMRLLAEALDRGKIQEATKQKEYFGFIVQECRRLSNLIGNVLDFSRIEQGRKKYQFEPTDFVSLVEQTVRLMTPNAGERQVRLELEMEQALKGGSLQPVWDGLAVQQALINLIDNALKHSPAQSCIWVKVEAISSEGQMSIRMHVQDQGPGIPAEDHERIFELFYRRGSELRRETQGVGIGLAIVKHIVQAHGGRICVESAVGEGSRFTIELPVTPENLCRES